MGFDGFDLTTTGVAVFDSPDIVFVVPLWRCPLVFARELAVGASSLELYWDTFLLVCPLVLVPKLETRDDADVFDPDVFRLKTELFLLAVPTVDVIVLLRVLGVKDGIGDLERAEDVELIVPMTLDGGRSEEMVPVDAFPTAVDEVTVSFDAFDG